jgi:hypothetical protein
MIFYKCRACGEVYGNVHTPNALITAVSYSLGKEAPFPGAQAGPTDVHFCDPDRIALADFHHIVMDKVEGL